MCTHLVTSRSSRLESSARVKRRIAKKVCAGETGRPSAPLHQIRQNDRLAVSKLVTQLTRTTIRSPLAQCLVIRYVAQAGCVYGRHAYEVQRQWCKLNLRHI